MSFDLYLNLKTGQYFLYDVDKGPGDSRPRKWKLIGVVRLTVIANA